MDGSRCYKDNCSNRLGVQYAPYLAYNEVIVVGKEL